MSPEVRRAGRADEAVAELISTIEDDLGDRGVRTQRANPRLEPSFPRLELQVIYWDAGDPASRHLGGSGEAIIVVDCFVTPSAGAQPTFVGRVRGLLGGGFAGGESINAVRQAGRTIAKAVATGDAGASLTSAPTASPAVVPASAAKGRSAPTGAAIDPGAQWRIRKPSRPFFHDGFFAQYGIGAVYSSDQIGLDPAPQGVTDPSISGFGYTLDARIGGTPRPGLVLGVGINISQLLTHRLSGISGWASVEDGRLVVTRLGNRATFDLGLQTIVLGAMVSIYPDPDMGLRFDGLGGLAWISSIKLSEALEYASSPFASAGGGATFTEYGYGLMLGIGYEWWIGEQWSLGPTVRVSYLSARASAPLLDLTETHSVFAPTLVVGVTHH